MSLIVRQAQERDHDTITSFNRLMASETEGRTLDPAVLAAGVAAVLADDDKGVYYVALDGEDVVGQLMLTREWSDWRNGWIWWLQSVYVRPEARRRGVFRALYAHVQAAAARNPRIVGLRLYVEKENRIAQETYRRLGMGPMPFLLFQRTLP